MRSSTTTNPAAVPDYIHTLINLNKHGAIVSDIAEKLLNRGALKATGAIFFAAGVCRFFFNGHSFMGHVLHVICLLLSAVFWAQVAALVAFIGVRDPQKQDMIRVRGTPALVIAGCAFVAGLMSLVCSLYNLGAIEMMMIQLVFNGAVFRYLWNGAVGPSNALVYGDYNTGLDNSEEYMYIV